MDRRERIEAMERRLDAITAAIAELREKLSALLELE